MPPFSISFHSGKPKSVLFKPQKNQSAVYGKMAIARARLIAVVSSL